MPVIWDNPIGYSFIATRACRACRCEDVRTLWSRPWEFAGEGFTSCLPEAPLTMPEVAGMLADAPFACWECGGRDASLVGLSMDESTILF